MFGKKKAFFADWDDDELESLRRDMSSRLRKLEFGEVQAFGAHMGKASPEIGRVLGAISELQQDRRQREK